ncbi:hypothetical protein AB0M43_36185 [Longispora sp. NPDC051575]|uniref:hypothetical protein n=1 Tax=Longispora sp. NPDC051575 TaxID=3154943 RepID=UPI00343DE53C
MSAWIVPDEHIRALVTAGLSLPTHGALQWYWPALTATTEPGQWTSAELHEQAVMRRKELTTATADRVGAMLAAANRDSVNHRYGEVEIEELYRHRQPLGRVDPLVILLAISCYEYQSCEHDTWKTSEAFQFCEALRGAAIRALPGYDTARGWPIDSESDYLNTLARRS